MRNRVSAVLAALSAASLACAPTALASTPRGRAAHHPASARPKASTAASSGGAGVAMAPIVPLTPGYTGPSTPLYPTAPGSVAKIVHGLAYAPAAAPQAVQEAIWAGNQIRKKPYLWGGGHGSFRDSGYDCSGTVSYVLHGAGMLSTPMDSSDFEGFGQAGIGQWITVYTNPGHAFVQIAGIRLDTSAEGDPHPTHGSGPRWRVLMTDTSGYDPRSPAGF